MTPELVVVEDLPREAVRRFLEAAPRTVALSGGSTVGPFYRALSRAPYDWPSVEFFFGDERCVPQTHQDSNFRVASETLLARVPSVVHPMPGATCDTDAYEAALRSRFGDQRLAIDLNVLGLGEDGHTASLFPGDPALEATDRWVVRVERPRMPPYHPRLTMTLPALSHSRLALFLVSGVNKREALARWLAGEDLPAARVAAGRVVILATPEAAA